MNSSGNSKALALKLPDFPFDPRHLARERFLDHRGLSLTSGYPANVASGDTFLPGDLAVNAAQQFQAKDFGRFRVIWGRNTGAQHESETIPAFIGASRKKLPMIQKKTPSHESGSIPR